LGIVRRSCYRWLKEEAWAKQRPAEPAPPVPPYEALSEEKQAVLAYARKHPELRHGELAWWMVDEDVSYVSPSSVYRILKEANLDCPWRRRAKRKKAVEKKATRPDQRWSSDLMYGQVGGRVYYSKEFRVVLQENGLSHHRIQPRCPEANGWIERANRTLREGLDGEELTDLLSAERAIARLVRRYNEERLHSALGYLPPWEYYRGEPAKRFEERRVKLYRARHHRRERNLELRQPTLPLERVGTVS
jgi:hypothetical protein